MYNLYNLNDIEFEYLAKDVVEKMLNEKLDIFSRGKDGGIDLRNFNLEIVVQCKHYKNFANLKSNLKFELEKVKKLSPKKYYIVTSLEMTPNQKDQIYEMFDEYMEDSSNIVHGCNIKTFLEEEDNFNIVKRHHKLWLNSTAVLEIIQSKLVNFEAEVLLKDIEKTSDLFVETRPYKKAVDILNEKNMILITGLPGTGKSITSNMLVKYLIAKDPEYCVRYVSSNNVEKLIESISDNRNRKEIILLDDFLGQTYLELRSQTVNPIKTLIGIVRMHDNKKLILNSRITILNQAKTQFPNLEKILEDDVISECVINMADISDVEKGLALYNHLYFSKIPYSYYCNILLNQNYKKIVNHKSFNMRIIEMCTNIKKLSDVKGEDYYEYIKWKLDHPNEIWHDEFVNRMNKFDVLLVNILYSLSGTMVNFDVLRKAFNKAVIFRNLNTEINEFECSISRLTNSIINIVVIEKIRYVQVINPSVNDYIEDQLKNNTAEIINLIKGSLYIEQVERLWSICKDVINQDIYNFKDYLAFDDRYNLVGDPARLKIKRMFEIIYRFRYKNENIRELILTYINNEYKTSVMLEIMLDDELREYYNFDNQLEDFELIRKILDKCNFGVTKNLLKYYENYLLYEKDDSEKEKLCENIISNFSDIFSEKVKDAIIEEVDSKLENMISQNDQHSISEEDMEIWVDAVRYDIIEMSKGELKYALNKVQLYDLESIKEIDIDYDDIVYNYNIESEITDYVKNQSKADAMYDDWKYYDTETTNGITLDTVFNQNYEM